MLRALTQVELVLDTKSLAPPKLSIARDWRSVPTLFCTRGKPSQQPEFTYTDGFAVLATSHEQSAACPKGTDCYNTRMGRSRLRVLAQAEQLFSREGWSTRSKTVDRRSRATVPSRNLRLSVYLRFK